MLIAIDHGNYAIKTPNFNFVSGLIESTVAPPFSDEILVYNGQCFSLTEKRIVYRRDKTKDEQYFILTLFAIGKELEAAGRADNLTRVDLGDRIGKTKKIAEKYGLTDLEYGVAEGRVLNGADGEGIESRSVGYTWMGAFDASLYARLWENDCHYLSVWEYLSDELFEGNPLIDYHVARLMSQFKGSTKLISENSKGVHLTSAEVKAFGAYDKESNTLRAFAYNFKNSYKYKRNADITLHFDVPEMVDGQVKFTLYRCDDDCNWYDEWREDWENYGITSDMYGWSSDDGFMRQLRDENARMIYETELRDKYAECSVLTPETYTAEIKDGKLTLNTQVDANTVVFFEISK